MNPPVDLSRHHWDVLWVLSKRGARKRVAVRRELADYYDRDVTDGEVRSTLDALVEFGLVVERDDAGQPDVFTLSERGRRALVRRRLWQEGPSRSINGP